MKCNFNDRLREELDSVLGSRSNITPDDLAKMQYTLCVYKETLRLWPPIPEIGRCISREIQINGHRIPKDTWVQVWTNFKSQKYYCVQ